MIGNFHGKAALLKGVRTCCRLSPYRAEASFSAAFLTLSCCFFIIGCAKQGYPPGGSADTAGPHALEFYPPLESIQVDPHLRPWIRLNEYPQRNSLNGAVFISPQPEGGFTVRAKSKRLEVRFANPLPRDRTIVITFGTKITDLYGNPMPDPVTLAFSTGDKIDRAAIAGQIIGRDNPTATWLWVYPLAANPDTTDSTLYPDPTCHEAPYATQADEAGRYRIGYLPAQQYRLFAVTETRRNRLWDHDQETIAFPPLDVWASEDTLPQVNLKLTAHDLTPPKLLSASALHRQDVHLKFSEPVATTEAILFAQNQLGQPLSLIDHYPNPADSSVLILTTAIQHDSDAYQVRLDRVGDHSGNYADSLITTFPAAVNLDTLGPRLVWSSPASGDLNFDPRRPLELSFSEAIIQTDLPRAAQLLDSAGSSVLGTWNYPASASGRYSPESPLISGGKYSWTINPDSLRDIFANISPDSLITLRFQTMVLPELGAISGVVKNSVPRLRIAAESLAKTGGVWETAVNPGGRWYLPELPAANYRLWLYLDKNRDDHFSAGHLQPFTFAEPFITTPDTVRVRARWETENVELDWNSP